VVRWRNEGDMWRSKCEENCFEEDGMVLRRKGERRVDSDRERESEICLNRKCEMKKTFEKSDMERKCEKKVIEGLFDVEKNEI
jgi:hypothetical protein